MIPDLRTRGPLPRASLLAAAVPWGCAVVLGGCAALLAGCSAPGLAVMPPPGVDLSGRWKLDEADSDDPQRVMQAQLFGGDAGVPGGGAGRGGRRGGGGRGGRGGGEGGEGAGPGRGAQGEDQGQGAFPMPPASVVGAGLRWPGKELEIKQIGGVAAFTSDGRNRVYQPVAPVKKHHGQAQQACGWDGKTLVVEATPDDDRPPFEERYTLSEDGRQLVQNVHFRRGGSRELTLSRVWDRVP